MAPYKFAIIGCSRIAESHIEAIQNSPSMELVAVSDVVPEKAASFGDRYQCHFYTDHNEMLEREACQIVNVCTPSGFHAGIAKDVALRKRHLIVEKPMCLNLADADDLIQTCRRQGVKLGVVHQLRFTPVIQELKTAILAGRLGTLSHGSVNLRWNRSDAYFAEAAWRGTKVMDGGAMLNQALHYIDILTWLFGPVTAVFGYQATRLRHIETEDVSVAVLKFKNGSLGSLEIAITVYPQNLQESLNIFAEKATVVLSGKYAHNVLKVISETDLGLTTDYDPPRWLGHQKVFADMLDAIEKNRDPLTNGEEARKALEIIFAIYEASETGREVVIR